MLEKLTIQCACSEHIPPNEYDSHLERCSNVSFPCPHKVCQEKVCLNILPTNSTSRCYLNRMIQPDTILNN